MMRFLTVAALSFGLFAGSTEGTSHASPPACHNPGHVFRVQAEWDNLHDGCGLQSQLIVQSTQADVGVVQVFYVTFDNCDGSAFKFIQATGSADVSGNIEKVAVTGSLPTSDGRSIGLDLDFRKTHDSSTHDGSDRTVSATAKGTVVLDGVDLTAGASSTTGSISRSDC